MELFIATSIIKYSLFIGFLFLSGFTFSAPSPCPRIARAVIDLGSGTTKMFVAEVEVCAERSKKIRTLDEESSRPLAIEASKNSKGDIPEEMQQQIIATLKEFKESAIQSTKKFALKDLEITVVGTHAFRSAHNQAELEKKIFAADFYIKALTQKEEAEAGLYAVQASGLPPGCYPDSLLVWDAGGGSMQFVRSASAPGSSPRVEGFNMGAEGFKFALLKKFKPQKSSCKFTEPSPNPIGKDQSEDVRSFARETAQQLLRSSLKSALKSDCVVGIGGVHSKALSGQLQKFWPEIKPCVCKDSVRACNLSKDLYQKVQIECLARTLSERSDCDASIKGPYSTTAVSNLYLILGWMDRLGIERVYTKAINMGYHFVLDRELLKFKKINVINQ